MSKAEKDSKKKDKNASSPQEMREKALNLALEQIEKGFGKGSIMKLGEQEKVEMPTISTGSIALDAALGIGGFPRGRIIEIYGPESSGKSTLALHGVANMQQQINANGQGGLAAYFYSVPALSVRYSRRLCVNTRQPLTSMPHPG